jgi:hypothetical protein
VVGVLEDNRRGDSVRDDFAEKAGSRVSHGLRRLTLEVTGAPRCRSPTTSHVPARPVDRKVRR